MILNQITHLLKENYYRIINIFILFKKPLFMRAFFYFRNNAILLLQILQKYWGHSNFRKKQEKIINSILEKKDTLFHPSNRRRKIHLLSNTKSNDGWNLYCSFILNFTY